MKQTLLSRLSRIEGQIRGLKRMVEEGEYCIDILNQAQAARSAISAFETLMLENHLRSHVLDQIRRGKEGKAIEEILKVYKLAQKK